MRALVATGNADPLVELTNVDEPALAHDELLVSVEAFSLNRPDFLWLSVPNPQWRVGIDFAGKVIQAAADGHGPAVGERVMVHAPDGGGGAELATAKPQFTTTIPANVSSETAAALPLAGLVALRLVREAAIKKGQRVLITGATGGVGHFAVELALNAGASVTALARPGEPVDTLIQRGAQVIYSLDEATEPFETILESIGGGVLTQAFAKLTRRGTILWFGAASGQPAQIDFFSFFPDRSSMTLKHFVYSEVEGDDAADLQALVTLVAAGVLNPHISRIEDWSQTSEVLKSIQTGSLTGKAVLTVKT